MSKKVLILSASPRKTGNSDTLCDQFMAGAIESNHQVDKVFLAEKKINYCTGCSACSGNGKCVQKDDMASHTGGSGERNEACNRVRYECVADFTAGTDNNIQNSRR